MEIMVPRTYKIRIAQGRYDFLNEQGRLTDVLNEITYHCDGGDLVGTIHLIEVTNKIIKASTMMLWTIEPEEYRSDDVDVVYIDQVDFEVEDCGIFYNA